MDDKDKPKKLKRIRMSSNPFILGLGGKEASKDSKMVFIDPIKGQHYTLRIIKEAEDILVLDFHLTMHKKEVVTEESHTPMMKIKFDLKTLKLNEAAATAALQDLIKRAPKAIENNDVFEGKVITPLANTPQDNKLLIRSKFGREATVNEAKLKDLVESIHGVEDLQRLGYIAAMVTAKDARGKTRFTFVLFKEGKWYYFDALSFFKQVFLILSPAISYSEGITKEEFMDYLSA